MDRTVPRVSGLRRLRSWLGSLRRAPLSERRILTLEERSDCVDARLDRIEPHVGIVPIEVSEWLHIAMELGSTSEPDLGMVDGDRLYLAFEDQFYASEAVTRKQAAYLPHVLEFISSTIRVPRIVDMGCGRGEFLDLLASEGIRAEGVEMNAVEATALRDQGYNIHHADANSFLELCDDGSIDVLVALQVIEHMTPEYFTRFISLIARKTAPSAMVILETPNAASPAVQLTFYTDLTHIRPYPKDTVRFYLEAVGFSRFDVLYSGVVPDHLRRPWPEANYMDYGLIASRRDDSVPAVSRM